MKKKFKAIKNRNKKSFDVINKICHSKIEKIRSTAVSLCQSEGFELIGLEYKQEFNENLIRLYLDKKDRNIIIDDCANISKKFSDILDIEWENCDPYRLEVSSPGLNRSLSKLGDFIYFKGKNAKITLINTLSDRKNFFGKILDVCENTVKLRVGKKTITIEYKNIAQARLMVFNGDS